MLPRERDAVLAGGALDDGYRGLDHFRADAVSGDYRDPVGFCHSNPVPRPQPAQYAQPTSTSAPHAGHFSSPSGGFPPRRAKVTLPAARRPPPPDGAGLPGGGAPRRPPRPPPPPPAR